MAGERPQRAVSTATQQRIAANLDADAEWADRHGYPESAENLRGQAQRYRAATDQTAAGEAAG